MENNRLPKLALWYQRHRKRDIGRPWRRSREQDHLIAKGLHGTGLTALNLQRSFWRWWWWWRRYCNSLLDILYFSPTVESRHMAYLSFFLAFQSKVFLSFSFIPLSFFALCHVVTKAVLLFTLTTSHSSVFFLPSTFINWHKVSSLLSSTLSTSSIRDASLWPSVPDRTIRLSKKAAGYLFSHLVHWPGDWTLEMNGTM